MSDDVKAKLAKRKEELEADFNKTNERREALIENGKKLNQELSELNKVLVRLQGQYSEVENLLGEKPKEVEKKESKK